jgi:ketosteroid isomerase-like protein
VKRLDPRRGVPILPRMRKTIIVLLSLVLFASAAYAADPADEVRAAETAFAKAFADRDAAKFFSFVAADATFFGGRNALKGKEAVVKAWSRFFESKEAPFAWHPETVAVNGAGTVGLSSGPVSDPKGEVFSTYSSVWIKQADGSWKVTFDGPGCPKCPVCEKK